jgi:hypothetical protein
MAAITTINGTDAISDSRAVINANFAALNPSGAVVGTTDSQTLTNKTLTAPAISSPTGLVKADVGLGNVDNTSDATKNAAVATLSNKTLTSPLFTGQYASPRYDAGDSSTALTLSFANGNCQKVRLTGNCTFTFTNPIAGGRYLLELLQDATGSRTVTWPATVKWSGGSAPTLTNTAGQSDIITLYYNGTNYAASSVLNFLI